jgi:Predicted glutamine amidotransferases
MAKPTVAAEETIYETTKLPDFEGKKVLVLPGAFYGSVVQMFAKCGFGRADTVEDADLVCFIGGVDINPEIYGQTKLPQTQEPSKSRDDFETEVFNKCVELGKPMYGICRGAQFLHAKNGGELWQHVEGHAGADHWIYDRDEDIYVLSNSIHHQMIALTAGVDLEVLAVCKDQVSSKFLSSDLIIDLKKDGANTEGEVEIEAGYYAATKCLFVQGHPEVGSPEFRSWCMTKLYDYMQEWDSLPEVQDRLDEWRRAALM